MNGAGIDINEINEINERLNRLERKIIGKIVDNTITPNPIKTDFPNLDISKFLHPMTLQDENNYLKGEIEVQDQEMEDMVGQVRNIIKEIIKTKSAVNHHIDLLRITVKNIVLTGGILSPEEVQKLENDSDE